MQTMEETLNVLRNEFALHETEDSFELFDGVNQEGAKAFVLLVDLPVLTRAHSLDIRVSAEFVSIYLFQIYKLQMGLPALVNSAQVSSFFDCKLRKLFLYLPVA